MTYFYKKYSMKLQHKFFSLFLLINTFCFGQQMPLDFESASNNFMVFGGSGFAFNPDPLDVGNTIGQFNNNGATASQGFYIDLTREIDLDTEKNITLRFYSYDPNSHTVKVKLEQGDNPDVYVELTTTAASQWKDLTFNFSNANNASDDSPVNATGTYNRFTIFIDDNVTTAGTYLIDDINDGSIPTDPNALDVIYTDLVWEDEFNGSGAIDSNKWHHQTFGPNGGQWYNGELQHYTNSQTNSFVSGGFLNIVAKRETTTQNGVQLDFTSARLNSKFAFTYGRVDVRAKLPFGNGTWPAIWTLGKNITEPGAWFETQGYGTTGWPACGEIDIMEHGLGALNHVSSALHTPSSFGATVNFQSFTLNDVANEFHVYSMNWSPNQITFLIDGVGFYTYNPAIKNSSTWPFFEDQFLLLNIAMGGIAGAVDAGYTESSMVIDYVKVYQNTTASTDDFFASKFSIYPNPSSNVINIRTDETIDKTQLYNTLGQLILNKDRNTKQLNIYSIKSGIYILKIYSGNKTVTKKVIIE
mgnify:FL=1|tara:strand:+ start:2542 stop:4125 length:1584 start_codon:yes stop_codon:yes gene_type:complete